MRHRYIILDLQLLPGDRYGIADNDAGLIQVYQIPAALEPIPVHRLSNFTKKYFDGGEGYHRGFSQCILQTVDNTLDDSTGQAAEILWTAENNFARSANIQRNMEPRRRKRQYSELRFSVRHSFLLRRNSCRYQYGDSRLRGNSEKCMKS